MVKQWTVKNGKRKASHFRKEPTADDRESNVLGLLKNGESVLGEFLLVRRASREMGFVKVKHLEKQHGHTWQVRNSDGTASTLLRKHPQETDDVNNTVGYAMEGELVEGEFLFVVRKGERRGGYMKVKNLRAVSNPELPNPRQPDEDLAERAALIEGLKRPQPLQMWTVMDSAHDGAWLRRGPTSDRSQQNIVCLVPNGADVTGEFIHVQAATSGQQGFVRFKDVQQKGSKVWLVKSSVGSAKTPLRKEAKNPEDDDAKDNTVCLLKEGERVDGEFIAVSYKQGKHQGYIKRHYLTALQAAAAVS
eukprot:TRINITY_DN4234_c1_g4_i1.p1 TRINITY_DN4234_c1_g4~~TRINITY_DN4234_c1_g4_i1.p1  ORF type:complete len:305 (+),score=62.81 TRINITY_DN4234_c1_g4_i1:66-980(+)